MKPKIAFCTLALVCSAGLQSLLSQRNDAAAIPYHHQYDDISSYPGPVVFNAPQIICEPNGGYSVRIPYNHFEACRAICMVIESMDLDRTWQYSTIDNCSSTGYLQSTLTNLAPGKHYRIFFSDWCPDPNHPLPIYDEHGHQLYPPPPPPAPEYPDTSFVIQVPYCPRPHVDHYQGTLAVQQVVGLYDTDIEYSNQQPARLRGSAPTDHAPAHILKPAVEIIDTSVVIHAPVVHCALAEGGFRLRFPAQNAPDCATMCILLTGPDSISSIHRISNCGDSMFVSELLTLPAGLQYTVQSIRCPRRCPTQVHGNNGSVLEPEFLPSVPISDFRHTFYSPMCICSLPGNVSQGIWEAQPAHPTSGALKSSLNGEDDPMNDGPSSFIIFPNPASSEISIRFDNGDHMQNTFLIYDLLGKAYPPKIQSISDREFKLDISTLPSGTYILQVGTSNRDASMRRFQKRD